MIVAKCHDLVVAIAVRHGDSSAHDGYPDADAAVDESAVQYVSSHAEAPERAGRCPFSTGLYFYKS